MSKKKKPHKMHAKKGSKYHSNLAGPKKKGRKKAGKKKAKKRAKKAGKKHAKKHAKRRSPKRDSVAAHMSAANKRGAGFGAKVTAHSLLTSVKKRRGKRWTCGGPVRTGCGGSTSRVIGKVR